MIDIHENCLWAKPVLDHGFVRVIDTMGNDAAIVQAARVSYGAGTKTARDDAGLIRYLMRHKHTTPLEMCEIKFHIKMPIFIARQHVRHRMASINEYSGRYSEMPDDMYNPEMFRMTKQHKANKQGSGDELIEGAYAVNILLRDSNNEARDGYQNLLQAELNRETARTVLNLNQYTEMYWKIDLHNLFHYLQLRMDSHAQWEIQQYANAMAEYVKQWVSMAWDAFEEYRLHGASFSRTELHMIRTGNYNKPDSMSDGEYREFKQKIGE